MERQGTLLRAVFSRILAGLPVFFIVTLGATALTDLMPGSPASVILGGAATQDQIDQLNARFGYDQPLLVRYWGWLTRLLRGDLGETLLSHQSVGALLLERGAVTFELAFLALFVSLAIAIPVALFTAMRPKSLIETLLRALSSVILSIPSFVIVVVMAFLFAVTLQWLPAGGWSPVSKGLAQNLRYAALPVACLALYETAFFYRVARVEFVATLQEDFILVARARGMSVPYILLRHALRPSLAPLTTYMGLAIGRLLGGSFIVESFFLVPGIGWTAINSVAGKDIAMLQGILLLAVIVYIVVFILIDLGYALIDPRVRVA